MISLNENLRISLKERKPYKVAEFTYKQGDMDADGLVVELADASLPMGSRVEAVWGTADSVPEERIKNAGDIQGGNKIVLYPPSSILAASEEIFCEFRILAGSSIVVGATLQIPVLAAWHNFDSSAQEDEEQITVLAQIVQLASDLEAAEAHRQVIFEEQVIASDEAAATASASATNADAKAALAQQAVNDFTNIRNSVKNDVITAVEQPLNTKVDQKIAEVNNAIASGTVDLETKDARTDVSGTVHANLKTRLDSDFDTLSNAIPKNLSFTGHETITADNTVSGNVNNGVVSGETWVNVLKGQFLESSYHFGGTRTTIEGDYVRLNLYNKGNSYSALKFVNTTLKPDTFYTVMIDVKHLGTPCAFGWVYNAFTQIVKIKETGTYIQKLKTKPTLTDRIQDSVCMTFHPDLNIGSDMEAVPAPYCLYRLTIVEGDHTDKPLEFFEGLKSAEISEVETHGVNLIDWSKVIIGQYITDTGANVPDATREITDFIPVKKGDVLRCDLDSASNGSVYWHQYDTNKTFIPKSGGGYRSVPPTNNFVVEVDGFVRVFRHANSTHKPYALYHQNDNKTKPFIPYESTKLTTESPVVLRSLPNGVADTLNLETGELTRRCGEVVLNGSESWTLKHNESNFMSFLVAKQNWANDGLNSSAGNIRSERFGSYNGGYYGNMVQEGYTIDGGFNLYIAITKSRLTTPDVAGFKAWLQANPTTVVYQLATPTTEIIDLDGYLKSHDYQTTITAPSVIPAKLSFDIPVSLKHWLEANSVSMTMLANDASTQQALIEQLNDSQETQDAEIVDIYEAAAMLFEQMSGAAAITLDEPKELSPMAVVYKKLIESGKRTINTIPEAIQEELAPTATVQ